MTRNGFAVPAMISYQGCRIDDRRTREENLGGTGERVRRKTSTGIKSIHRSTEILDFVTDAQFSRHALEFVIVFVGVVDSEMMHDRCGQVGG